MPLANFSNLGEVIDAPLFKGTITSLDSGNDTAMVEVTIPEIYGGGARHFARVPLFYHCADEVAQRENGALEGAAAAFSEGDEVFVQMAQRGASAQRILGRVEGKRPCCSFAIKVYQGYVLVNLSLEPLKFVATGQFQPCASAGTGQSTAPTSSTSEDYDWFTLMDQSCTYAITTTLSGILCGVGGAFGSPCNCEGAVPYWAQCSTSYVFSEVPGMTVPLLASRATSTTLWGRTHLRTTEFAYTLTPMLAIYEGPADGHACTGPACFFGSIDSVLHAEKPYYDTQEVETNSGSFISSGLSYTTDYGSVGYFTVTEVAGTRTCIVQKVNTGAAPCLLDAADALTVTESTTVTTTAYLIINGQELVLGAFASSTTGSGNVDCHTLTSSSSTTEGNYPLISGFIADKTGRYVLYYGSMVNGGSGVVFGLVDLVKGTHITAVYDTLYGRDVNMDVSYGKEA